MGGGVVQAEQRAKGLQGLLRDVAAHFLRFVHDDNGSVGGNDVDGTARRKFIALGVDNARFFAASILLERGGKRLGIDNHDVDAAVGGKGVQLV